MNLKGATKPILKPYPTKDCRAHDIYQYVFKLPLHDQDLAQTVQSEIPSIAVHHPIGRLGCCQDAVCYRARTRRFMMSVAKEAGVGGLNATELTCRKLSKPSSFYKYRIAWLYQV